MYFDFNGYDPKEVAAANFEVTVQPLIIDGVQYINQQMFTFNWVDLYLQQHPYKCLSLLNETVKLPRGVSIDFDIDIRIVQHVEYSG